MSERATFSCNSGKAHAHLATPPFAVAELKV
jgi:hypothetical protein